MKIRVGLVEDDVNLIKSTSAKLGLFEDVELIFTAQNGNEALEHIEKSQVHIILMDINMPEMNGIEATSRIKKISPDTKVIIHTIFDDNDKIFESILAGASGYLLKDEKPNKLFDSITEALEGGAPMSRSIATKTLQLIRKSSTKKREEFNLTKRELEILNALASGQNYNLIAEELFISPKTVRKHIENIYQKLQVHSKVEAVQLALKHGIIGTR
ncbi:MAG: response regulator transcription factor [Balneolaceae bacterium]|nr:response regulator transcription factor [Balneolaceae bacterium]MBO6546090.1 response regulator transcription factor [Balneolaceae bacterium]MBO6647486.1 response regulator transcription factor [Balneolaceae bacterium]